MVQAQKCQIIGGLSGAESAGKMQGASRVRTGSPGNGQEWFPLPSPELPPFRPPELTIHRPDIEHFGIERAP
jgi:hypothetical protein